MKNQKHNSKHSRAVSCILALAVFLSIASYSKAQDQALPKASLITTFPFSLLDGGTIILRATVGNSTDSLNFVLDTGSGGISLDSSTAEKLHLISIEGNKNIVGLGLFKRASFISNQTLHLPGLHVDTLDFHVNDYEFLTISKGIKIDGIIGYSFLKRFIVKVNYDDLKLEVWQPGEMKYPKNGYALGLYLDNMPMFEVKLKDNTSVTSRFFFDTGADVSFIMSEKFATDSKVLKTNKKALIVPAEGIGGASNMKFTTLARLQIGPYTFKNVPSYVFNDKYNVTRYPQLGGIVGNDLLHRFNLIINYPYAEIYLMPNSHFKEPFDYAYTGFKIFTSNGNPVIDNVVKGSPAEKAGLQNGDLLLGVNNNFSNSLEHYRNEIYSSRSAVKMSILRNNEVKTIVVLVERIL